MRLLWVDIHKSRLYPHIPSTSTKHDKSCHKKLLSTISIPDQLIYLRTRSTCRISILHTASCPFSCHIKMWEVDPETKTKVEPTYLEKGFCMRY
jgi:hypothetical protein